MKILLDTDIGTDVDDAVCLAYLLANPACELVGITTVTGEANKRASLASVLCQAAGKEVPIYPGSETPMAGDQRQAIAQGAAVLPRWPHRTDFPQGEAVDFMQRTIRAFPDEITLLTVGPLTNVGRLFTADPDCAHLLKGMASMGGMFGARLEGDSTEWNVSGDPLATEIVYRAPLRFHRSLGLEVTQQVVMEADQVRQRFTAPLLQPVLGMAEIWFAQFFPSITFHDPLTAATLFDEGLCTYQQGTVTVERAQEACRTRFLPGGETAPHQVAVSVDAQRYFDHFFGFFGGVSRDR